MDIINAEWLKQRLAGDRGKKAEFAQALGITTDKVSKMLSGLRKPQVEDVPAILAFFGEAEPTVDPELAALWSRLEPSERMFLLNAAKAQVASRDTSQSEPDSSDG